MRIAMIGTGYVGLVSGACLSELGASVVCVDNDATKISRLSRGTIDIYEPGLAQLVASNMASDRLRFTNDLAASVKEADLVFIAVGTPSCDDGGADLSYVFAVAESIGLALAGSPWGRTLVVTKSTVPVGTGQKISRILRRYLPPGGFQLASNPEFLREGSAVADFMRPERIIIGAESEQTRTIMRKLYRPLDLIGTPMLFTTIETAELIKYAANAFLANKIAFINEIADVCEALGANVQDVAHGIGLDSRIGRQFLQVGPGFGGSCFPKDCQALVRAAESAQTPLSIVPAVIRANEKRKHAMAQRIVAACGGDVAGKTLAVLGLTFKPNTDDLRDSPSLVILPALLEAGAKVRVFDPAGMDEARKLMPELDYQSDAYKAMDGADALVVLTEWNEFRTLSLDRVERLLKTPLVIDLRNMFFPQDMACAGLVYHSIGRKAVHPANTGVPFGEAQTMLAAGS